MEGIVVKNVSNLYEVLCKGKMFFCGGTGKLKQEGKILVGDKVAFDVLEEGRGIIKSVLKRKNFFIRPPVANIDILLIVISPVPKPDFVLVDKLLLLCATNNIKPIICINKSDILSKEQIQDYKDQYKAAVKNVVFISAKDKANLEALKKLLKNKLTAIVGQSAVGKSSIVNALTGENIKTGEVSLKSQRGKQTTRHTQLFLFENLKLIDTAGFSSFEIALDYKTLGLLYPDFSDYINDCKYTLCSHTGEGEAECAIKRGVKNGIINQQRYERYVYLYKELKNGKALKINLKNPER